jgi:hypothetical protein
MPDVVGALPADADATEAVDCFTPSHCDWAHNLSLTLIGPRLAEEEEEEEG